MSDMKRRPTMQDIADIVGVSKALVSLVFRNAPGPSAETRALVLAAAGELGYRLNRTAAMMTARRTHLIGVVADIRNSFHAEVVEEIAVATDAAGYEIVLGAVTPTHPEEWVVDTLLDFRCEGMLLIGTELPIGVMHNLGAQVPTSLIGRRITSKYLDVVRTADGRGIGATVDHLVSLGHRRIAHVSGGSGFVATDRRNGYQRAMRRHRIADQIRVVGSGFTERHGMAAAMSLVDHDLPSAVVCSNDRIAVGVIDAFRRMGVAVPNDVSVAGFDDSVLGRLGHIDLTTVSQQPRVQAQHAVDALVSRLDHGRSDPLSTVLVPQLIVRSTTAPVHGRSTSTPNQDLLTMQEGITT